MMTNEEPRVFKLTDGWNHSILEIITLSDVVVEVYHIKNDYIAEICLDKTVIKFNKPARHNIWDLLGKLGIEYINYHSSNGSVIKQKLKVIETEDDWCGKKHIYKEYKYVKVKE